MKNPSSGDKFTVSQEKTEINVAVIQTDIGYIKAKMEEMNKKFDILAIQYVTKSEFQTVRAIVYGLVGIILTAVLGTILFNMGLKLR